MRLQTSRWLFVALGALLTLFAVRRLYSRFYSPNLVLTFFDVGQGDASLVQFPMGRTLLIDAGGGFNEREMGTREIVPELARLGILRLDAALLSHPDNDHARGFLGVFQNLSVSRYWLETRYSDRSAPPLLREIEAIAFRRGANLENVTRPFSERWGAAELSVYPIDLPKERANAHMLVLFIRFAGCTIFYSGDLEAEGERTVADLMPPVTILKVAHHGSRTSSTEHFLKVAHPQVAIISVGVRNHYGHPTREAISRLIAGGAQVFRTDFDGFVRLTVTPEGKIFCETSHGYCGESRCSR